MNVLAPPSTRAPVRRSIATRVILLVAVGNLATLGVLGIVSWRELQRAEDTVIREQQALAIAAAARVDEALTGILSELQRLANDARALVPFSQNREALDERTLNAWLATGQLDGVCVVTLDRRVRARAPEGAPLSRVHVAEAVSRIMASARPAITSVIPSPDVGPRILLLVPLRSWQGELVGVVIGDVDPASRRFGAVKAPFVNVPLGELDLVDNRETLLASSDPHHATLGPEPVVARAPLSLASWHVIAHRAESLVGPGGRFARVLSWLAPLLIGGSLLLAWGAGQSVRRPLLALTAAANRLASGDLETPITIAGTDEIGQLGGAFESMREALEAARRETDAVNAELESRVRRRTEELARANEQLRDRERVRQSLLRKVITAQEDERKRIARELHDDAVQTVTALGLHLEGALADVPADAPIAAELRRARELAARSLDELHRLMHDLRPALLDDLGLVAAIRWYTEKRLARTGISAKFESTVSRLRLPVELETAVFRAVQEALTNVERHAEASMVLVQLDVEKNELVIDVEDDGAGFDPALMVPTPNDARGLGLLGIRERMELVGGEAKITSKPGQGTLVSIRVRLPEGAVDAEDPRADR